MIIFYLTLNLEDNYRRPFSHGNSENTLPQASRVFTMLKYESGLECMRYDNVTFLVREVRNKEAVTIRASGKIVAKRGGRTVYVLQRGKKHPFLIDVLKCEFVSRKR